MCVVQNVLIYIVIVIYDYYISSYVYYYYNKIKLLVSNFLPPLHIFVTSAALQNMCVHLNIKKYINSGVFFPLLIWICTPIIPQWLGYSKKVKCI